MWTRIRRRLAKIFGRDRRAALVEPPAVRIGSSDWAKIYSDPIEPVSCLANPIARAIAERTSSGDVLLEAGCGSATISAELATAGRQIVLCDFSHEVLLRASRLFEASRLPAPVQLCCDISKPLPCAAAAVDTVWSAGVLEHWSEKDQQPIVAEMARIARKSVIALVPNARSMFYRFGKHVAEQRGTWRWGLELPCATLRPVFEAAGLVDVQETTLNAEEACYFLSFFDASLEREAARWYAKLDPADPVLADQGYLLLTVGSTRRPAPAIE